MADLKRSAEDNQLSVMKNKTALKRSLFGLKFALAATVISGACFAVWNNWVTGAALAFSLFHVVMDGVNVLYIRRKVIKNPQFLEEKID